MNKAIAFTGDSLEELAALANKAALECGGEVASIQVIKMESVEADDVWFAAMVLLDAPEVVPADEPPAGDGTLSCRRCGHPLTLARNGFGLCATCRAAQS